MVSLRSRCLSNIWRAVLGNARGERTERESSSRLPPQHRVPYSKAAPLGCSSKAVPFLLQLRSSYFQFGGVSVNIKKKKQISTSKVNEATFRLPLPPPPAPPSLSPNRVKANRAAVLKIKQFGGSLAEDLEELFRTFLATCG